jgi:hypothetical protein
MVINKNWEKKRVGANPKPKREETIIAMEIAKKTTNIIAGIKPIYWFIENPRGMLRKMPFMRGWHKSSVTYCKYGLKYRKATDIWNNCFEWKPRPVCSSKSPCVARAATGTYYGSPGIRADGSLVNSVHPFVMGEAKGQESVDKHYRRLSLHQQDMGDQVGWGATVRRAIVPVALCEEIIDACEHGLNGTSTIDANDTSVRLPESHGVTNVIGKG